jgi:hypothetical protein
MSQELEDRFHNYGKRVRDFCLKLKWDLINTEYIDQLGEITYKLQMIWESWMRR